MFASVIWPKGKPPSDIPECGFNDELCEWLANGKVQFRIETYKRIINKYIKSFQYTLFTVVIFLRHRNCPAGCPCDLPPHRCSGSFVDWGPHASKVSAPDEAG